MKTDNYNKSFERVEELRDQLAKSTPDNRVAIHGKLIAATVVLASRSVYDATPEVEGDVSWYYHKADDEVVGPFDDATLAFNAAKAYYHHRNGGDS